MKIRLPLHFLVLGIFLGFVFLALPARATYLVGGELTFHADTTNTSSILYFFKLVLYKEKGQTEPDAITASLNFGDGTTVHVDWTSRTLLSANVYPNPVHTYFKVDNEGKFPAQLFLYNTSSQLVLTQALRLKQNHIKRPGGLKAGIYYYIILANQEKIARTGKLLVW